MLDYFVSKWDEGGREALRESFKADPPTSYQDIVKRVVGVLAVEGAYDRPDPERIVRIDHGDYSGTLLFIIGASGYQPSQYWVVKVSYGSCSACDAFQSIRDDFRENDEGEPDYSYTTLSESQLDRYLVLALHILQRLKEL